MRVVPTPSTVAAIVLAVLMFAPGVVATAQSRPPDRTAYAQARDSAYARPVNRSLIAFTLQEKDLLAENVAHDPVSGAFFVGSTRHGKIVRRDRDGRISDFAPTGRDGMWMVIGMKVDSARRTLWVNTSGGGNYVRHRPADQGRAALLAFDLESGRLLRRLEPAEEGPHFFNDLVVLRDGTVYLTDMSAAAIYRLRPRGVALERWHVLDAGTAPNGIALSGDERTLYVASNAGISAIDLASGERHLLAPAEGVDPLGIDGLYGADGALIGIQGWRRNRVQRFALSADGRSITGATVLEANHPMFMNPTTGVLAGGALFYIANSQFASFDADEALFPAERLFETVVLRLSF